MNGIFLYALFLQMRTFIAKIILLRIKNNLILLFGSSRESIALTGWNVK